MKTIVTKRLLSGLPANHVVLTFDDGPNPNDDTTERLLDVLESRQVTASFCLVGQQVLHSPETVRRIHAAGHHLVNHSFSHPLPWGMTAKGWRAELNRCDEALAEVLGLTGFRAPSVRPPYGVLTRPFREAIAKQQRPVAIVTHYAFDTYCSPCNYHRVVQRIVRTARTQQGGIFVLHDHRHRRRHDPRFSAPRSRANRSWVPAAVEQLIETLRDESLTFRGSWNV